MLRFRPLAQARAGRIGSTPAIPAPRSAMSPTFAFAWRNLEGSPQYRPAESDAVGYVSGCPNQPMMGDLCRSDFALQHGLIGVHK
jgi:hypothetical protein